MNFELMTTKGFKVEYQSDDEVDFINLIKNTNGVLNLGDAIIPIRSILYFVQVGEYEHNLVLSDGNIVSVGLKGNINLADDYTLLNNGFVRSKDIHVITKK